MPREFNKAYAGDHLRRVAFPLGGIGSGMVCLEGTGALSHVSLRHRPDLFNEPLAFAALCVRGERENVARVLEGPVPPHKPLFPWGRAVVVGSGSGAPGRSYGLPRLREATFRARFPFASVSLAGPGLPLGIELCGWSPFIPGNADDSSLPLAALEYRFVNRSEARIDAVFSFHSANFMLELGAPPPAVLGSESGFVLWQPGSADAPWREGAFSASVDAPGVRVDCRWFRGGWFDSLTMKWRSIARGEAPQAAPYEEGSPSPGGSLYVPLALAPGEERTVRLRLAWYVPVSDLRTDAARVFREDEAAPEGEGTYRPWYAARFRDVADVERYWSGEYERLRAESSLFSDCLHDTTLPPEVIEAVAANLSILKSPTLLRQADGRLWAWEGCGDSIGCCAGSCTHVWNYAQAIPHLFPELERGLRETELGESQSQAGHQCFRTSLPIREAAHDFHAAADGQLGGILRSHREWRISGDGAWLKGIWPRLKRSLAYAIETWDPDRQGLLVEPHHNTYDIAELLAKGRARLESELWNGEYFHQRIEWEGLRAASPLDSGTKTLEHDPGYSPEAAELLRREGPKYQYGEGCLSDGVLGAWLARVCGVGDLVDPEKVRSHLRAVHRYNLRRDLSEHANPQRSGYAFGAEGGLLLCSWPRGGEPSLPFVYSNEVWTGIEYQVASHLIMYGLVEEGLEIVRTCRRRYDGRVRNPFDEIECGHFYARALASYALLQALSGARYDAVERKLYLDPALPGDFRAFIATATGFGTVGVKDGEPFLEVRHGTIEVESIDLRETPFSEPGKGL
jgi:uncharacterized protein (DUF608 family)